MALAENNKKYCPDCEQEKPLSAFGVARGRQDGLTFYCKECRNRKQRKKYHSDPELRACKYARAKKRYADDSEAHEQQLERQRKWYREHWADPEYRASENERHRKSWRESERRRQLKLASDRKYVRRRYASDPDFKAQVDARNRRYFHQKRANGGSYTQAQWEMLLDLCGNRCMSCGEVTVLEVDHIVPVYEGGTSDITNLQPLCRSCNASKGTTVTDFRPSEVITVVEASYI